MNSKDTSVMIWTVAMGLALACILVAAVVEMCR